MTRPTTILVSYASGGFGALAARRLADAGHHVHAGMPEAALRPTSPPTSQPRPAWTRWRSATPAGVGSVAASGRDPTG